MHPGELFQKLLGLATPMEKTESGQSQRGAFTLKSLINELARIGF